MFKRPQLNFLYLLSAMLLFGFGCNQKEVERQLTGNPKLDKLKLPDGFVAELLYSPGENEQGSWVAMTKVA